MSEKKERKRRAVLSSREQVRVNDWLRANWPQILRERPSQDALAVRMAGVLEIAHLNSGHVARQVEALELTWPNGPAGSRLDDKRKVAPYTKILASYVADLYVRRGDVVPDAVSALAKGEAPPTLF